MELANTVIEYIGTQLMQGRHEIGMDTNLFCDGYLDSTAMLELILWIGDTFNITVQNEDLTPENFGTPRNIVEFVLRQGKTAEAQGVA
jgi:acyl carrier protein